MHVHAVKGDAECQYWLHPDRFDIVEDFEYNCTAAIAARGAPDHLRAF